jgi:MYXO-CTERM domain-containing protein
MIDCSTSTFGSRLGTPSNYFVTTNYAITGAPKASKHAVAQILTPTPTAVCGNDIAILILSDIIAPAEAVPAIPNTTHSLTDQSFYNSNGGYTAIGYGQTSPTGSSGTRYMLKDIQMGCIYGDCSIDCAKVPAADLPPGTISENEFIGGDGTCEGDSGSSAWMQDQFDSNTFISMGLLSRGGTSGGNCVGSIWTRVDVWHDFIVQAAQTASSNWTTYPKPTPDWTVYTPPPACPGGSGPAKKDGGATPAVDSGVGTTPVTGDDGGSASGSTNNATTTTTTSGCAMAPAPDPSKPVPWKTLMVVGLAALGLVVRRRRST